MPVFQRVIRGIGTALVAVGLLSGCGGSRGTLPALPNREPASVARTVSSAGTDVVAIDAGGAAAGAFAADKDFAAAGTWTYSVVHPIDTAGVANPAPQAVYASARVGSTVAYTIPGLTPGNAYSVTLSFAETYWTAAGKRSFNVSLNGAQVLTNFDIFAVAGARFKAVVETFTATASPAGTIALTLRAVKDNAVISAIEIAAGSAGPTPPPGGSVQVNAGGAATGSFLADTDFAAGGTWTSATTATIDTSGVSNPAPQAVFADQRVGAKLAYTIGGLTAGATYSVRLDFAELYWTAAGQRVFNVSINNAAVLNGYDILAATKVRYKAIAPTFTAVASSSGTIAITLTAVVNYAVINGIEIVPGGSATPPPAAFNDYVTFGFDNQRDVFNPKSTALAPASVSKLHLAWQAALGGGDYNTQTQPILATGIPGHAGVLFVGGGSGRVYGYDALSGGLIWTTNIGQMSYSHCGSSTSYFGTGGTAAYDPDSKSLYVVGNTNASLDAFGHNSLYRLDAATGHILSSVNFTTAGAGPGEQNFSHTSVALQNGLAYVGTGSTCDISSWRGRVVAVNVPSMTIANTFFTLWDPQNARGAGKQSWGGGGIWGWGGVALDFSANVLTGVGNANNFSSNGTIVAPFVVAPTEYSGYAETLLELSPNVSTVVAANHPIPTSTFSKTANDLDVQGTPLVFRPAGTGCDTMVAIQGKSGELTFYRESAINAGPAAQYQLSSSSSDDAYLGDPAYSPATGLVYADVAASVSPTLFSPGLIAIDPGCGRPSVAWRAAFGSDSSASGLPRSVPAVSAGGVIVAGSVNGSHGSVWALNASTGEVLHGGTPLLQTSGHLRVPPTIDGDWVFVLDNSGNMYGLTIDPNFAAIQAKYRAPDSRLREHWPVSHD